MLFIDLFANIFKIADKEPLIFFKNHLTYFQSNYKLKFRIPWDYDYVI